MFTIDITLKNTPLPISIQRKEAEAAEAVYQQILAAMRSSTPQIIELTCEKQEDKKVAVLSDRISAVMVGQKSGATASGRGAGFVASAVGE
jgi:NAD(P)H-hydrate repair Nnr-like enzyme with NAD(P)H-hydrate dehydratase domain